MTMHAKVKLKKKKREEKGFKKRVFSLLRQRACDVWKKKEGGKAAMRAPCGKKRFDRLALGESTSRSRWG